MYQMMYIHKALEYLNLILETASLKITIGEQNLTPLNIIDLKNLLFHAQHGLTKKNFTLSLINNCSLSNNLTNIGL